MPLQIKYVRRHCCVADNCQVTLGIDKTPTQLNVDVYYFLGRASGAAQLGHIR